MYIVTGGAGFIGSNIVHELNRQGIRDILIVDHLAIPAKLENLRGAQFTDFMDKREFRKAICQRSIGISKVEAIFHQGACSDTLVDDGVYMMDNNFTCSKEVLEYSIGQNAPLVYASTAAVYGSNGPGRFTPTSENEKPLNIYGFSKLAFDNYVRHRIREGSVSITVVGLRYFNVYGPREQHKGRMASVIHHFSKQICDVGKVQLFEGSGGYANGEQKRDFVYVGDLVQLNLFFAQKGQFAPSADSPIKTYQGVVNAGSGHARSFNDVVSALTSMHGSTTIEYVPFPVDLKGRYQHFTEADLSGLHDLGCNLPMTPLEDGVRATFTSMELVPL